MNVIDLRSDTLTRPTPAMREAIAHAEVGDDVYGEDPSTNRLQARAAELLGKQAALFVPSGSMANQVAIRSLTRHGDLILAGEGAHLLHYESGGAAALSGVQVQTIGSDGFFDADDLRAAVTPVEHHYAPTALVAVENTHNRSGGRVFPFEQLKGVAEAAQARGLRLHLDGARLFNAAVATGIAVAEWARPFDTVSFCLSKGLGAPAGSLVCGSAETIHSAHRFRKMFGGGMRQAGILAAAGLYALEHHVERLAVDHLNARRLAAGLSELGLEVDPDPETNMVLFRFDDTAGFVRAIEERGLRINPIAPGQFRAVTHLDVSPEDVDDALRRIDDALLGLRRTRSSPAL